MSNDSENRVSNPGQPELPRDLSRHMAVGSTWMVAMRWAIRGIGLVSTMILARLLAPHDFGLVAKAMLVVGMLEIMAETGQRLAIIRHKNPTREYYDTAWTISLLVNSVLALALLIAAPLANTLFHEPAAVILVRILAVRTALNGIENIGTVDFRRHMQFSKDFQYNLVNKVCTFAVTITLALIFRNYVALVGGIVAGQIILVVLSFIVSPYRPRLSLEKFSEIWSYSFWVLISSTGMYLLSKLDQWVLSTQATDSLMGQYTVGSELAQLPTSEVISPAQRALYPAYSRLWASSLEEMTRALVGNLRFIAIICASMGVGVASVAHDFVLVILGPQWTETAQFVVFIALSAAIAGFNSSAAIVLNVTGHVRRASALSWSRVALAVPCLLLGYRYGGALGISQSLLIANLLFTPGFYTQLLKVVPLTWGDMLGIVWRPILASGFMAFVLRFDLFAGIDSAVIRLPCEVTTGAICFSSVLYLLWFAAGKPAGSERIVVEQLRARLLRFRRA
jgi:O-antigen/teichoic acid export membrane protein